MNGDDLSSFEAELGFDTLAIRAGYQRTHEAEHNEAIFPTSSYVYQSAAQAAARFAGDEVGNIYSRFTNPTVRAFENRLAALEGAEACVATSSGMAAIMSTCLGLLKAGDHIVASRSIFGSTVVLFNNYMMRFNVDVTYVDLTDLSAWEAAIKDNSKILFLETPSNPLVEVADIKKLAALAHQYGCLLVVDNCLCTPALQKTTGFRCGYCYSFSDQISGWSGSRGWRCCAGFKRSGGWGSLCCVENHWTDHESF